MKSNQTMDYLTERIRTVLGDDPRVTEKTMFGGLTFLLDGHIIVGCKKDGRILLSVGREHFDEALTRSGAAPMVHGGRQMTGFVWVEADAIEDDDALRAWVNLAYRWVSQMPPDDPKKKAAGKTKSEAGAATPATGRPAKSAARSRRAAS